MAQTWKDDESGKVKSDALIYQQREEKNARETYEELDRKGKFQFFKDYYLGMVVGIAALAILLIFYYVQSMNKPQTALYVAVADDVFSDEKVKELEKAVETYLGLDGKRQKVEINTNYSYRNPRLSKQIQEYIYAGSCDVVIASEEGFKSWAQVGYFFEPETSDVVSIFKTREEKDKMYCRILDGAEIRGEKEEDTTEYNVGVSVQNCRKYKELEGNGKPAYVGVANSTKHPEEAAAFLEFLLDDEKKAGDVHPDFQVSGD